MRRYYYWLICRDDMKKPYLVFGSDKSEDDARQKGLEILGGLDFEIKRYPTRDLGTASAYFRGKRLERGDGLSASTQRIGHNRSIEKLKKRMSRRTPSYDI